MVAPGQSGVGIVVLDRSLTPIYANTEAVHVLAYDEKGATVERVGEQVRSLLSGRRGSRRAPTCTEFVSGKRRYMCRFFALQNASKNSREEALAVLLERGACLSVDVARIAAHFGLTPREQATLALLVQGLSTKEIAERMDVSPNTIKAFLRLIMIKMGVSTRGGIVGNVLKEVGQGSPARPNNSYPRVLRQENED